MDAASAPLQQQNVPAAAAQAQQPANGEAPTGDAPAGLVYPALHLLPLNNTFIPKQISLSPAGTRVKIGRQTNAKTVPSANNGYFDSKVLSRMHAEVWSEDGKVYIKDVKSSNGTFINGDRLSPESAESDAFELHSEDVVEFGIDIVSDDNKTIVHHKVSTKVHIAVTAEEALTLMKNLPALYRMHDNALHRRPSKAGLTFDHVFNRLQTELHKSRETGGELGGLTNVMAEIHDTLGGGVPPPLPQFPQPARAFGAAGKGNVDPQALASLQAQLTDAQASLAGHADKVRRIDNLLLEHESMKTEVGALRNEVETHRRSFSSLHAGSLQLNGLSTGAASDESDERDFDDNASTTSVETVRSNHMSSTQLEDRDALVSRVEALSRDLAEMAQQRNALEEQQELANDLLRRLEDRVERLEQQLEDKDVSLSAWQASLVTNNERFQESQRSEWQQWRQVASDDPRSSSRAVGGASLSSDAQGQNASIAVDAAPPSLSTSSAAEKTTAASSGPSAVATAEDGHRQGHGQEGQSSEGYPPDAPSRASNQGRLAGSSLPVAGTVGLIAVGVAVWMLATRAD